jgi:ribonuclease HI
MNMVLYIDGSHRKVPVSRRGAVGARHVLGYGLLALYQDCCIEQFGGLAVPPQAEGDHEMVALVAGVKFALDAGVPFERLSVYTDDEVVALGPQFLHEGNFLQSRGDQVRERLRRACACMGLPELFEETLRCLVTSRFTKLKAHRRSVYNNRTDYLAKCGSLQAMGEPACALPYEDWLQQGFQFYLDDGATTETWYPPFVEPLAA